MSSVTREQIIGLLRKFQQRMAAKRGMCDEHDRVLWDSAESIIAALQAAEPMAEVIHNFVGVDIAWCDPPSSGRPPAGTKLFTLPCPP